MTGMMRKALLVALAEALDRHWLTRPGAKVGCSCGEWEVAVLDLKSEEGYFPAFSRHVAAAILAALPADWCEHDRVIEAYKQAIRDLGSSPDAQANIAVQLMQAEIARLRRIEEAARALYGRIAEQYEEDWIAPDSSMAMSVTVSGRDLDALRAALEEKP
jgi:hypothetical protein